MKLRGYRNSCLRSYRNAAAGIVRYILYFHKIQYERCGFAGSLPPQQQNVVVMLRRGTVMHNKDIV